MNKTKLPLLILAAAALVSCGGSPASSSLASSQALEIEEYDLLDVSAKTAPTYTGNGFTGVTYEIFVYSFADSNGDGIGDLKGIEGKLDYLAELGVENLWLTPIHPSNTYHKYNVRDYFSIDSDFGTMADFESLVAKAKAKGMKITMDMVFNHSGRDHAWFSQAVSDFASGKTGSDSLADLYVLSHNLDDERFVGKKTSSVTVSGKTVYYECNFDSQMPEFNLDSSLAKAKHKEIMDFWLNKGVGGFRFDGAAYYYLNENKKCIHYAKYLSDEAKKSKSDVYLIAEYWPDGSDVRPMGAGGMSAFVFDASTASASSSPLVAQKAGKGRRYSLTVEDNIHEYLKNSNGELLPSFFSSNHDQDRWAQRLATQDMTESVALQYLLTPGTPYLYYGEEIGLLGIRQTAETDWNRRLPMQWVADKSKDTARTVAGGGDYSGKQTTLGALEAIKDEKSLTSFYKKAIAFRKAHPEIQKGSYLNIASADAPFSGFDIKLGSTHALLIHSVYEEPFIVNVPKNATLDETFFREGSSFDKEKGKLTLSPYSTAYLTIPNS